MTAAFAIYSRDVQTNGLRVYSIEDDQLVNLRAYSSPRGRADLLALNPSGTILAHSQQSAPRVVIRSVAEDGSLGAAVDVTSPDEIIQAISWSADGRLWIFYSKPSSGPFDDTNIAVYEVDEDEVTATLQNTFDAGYSTLQAGDCSPSGNHAIVIQSGLTSIVRLLSINGTAVTLQNTDVGSVSNKRRVGYHSEDRIFIGHTDGGISLARRVGAALEPISFTTAGHAAAVSGNLIHSWRAGVNARRMHSLIGLHELWSASDFQLRGASGIEDGRLWAGAKLDAAALFEWNGTTLVELQSESWSSTLVGVQAFKHEEPPPDPPTEEDVFRATFAEAFGNPPLVTALTTRADARALAGHGIINYLYPPDWAAKRFRVLPEELDLVRPGNFLWHQDPDDPAFSLGRWAQIQRRAFTLEPDIVELGLRISDHPQSFIPPPAED